MISVSKAAVAGCALLFGWPAQAAAAQDDRKYFLIEGFAVQHEERIPERDLGFGARLGLGFPISGTEGLRTAFELSLFGNPIERDRGSGDDQLGLMLDVVNVFETGPVDPFIYGGLGAVQESIGRVDGTYAAFEAGAGLLFTTGNQIKVRIGVSAQSVFNDEVRPNQDAFVDTRFNLGLLLPFGAGGAPPPPPPVTDSDSDGVLDPQDLCPATPVATRVGADGCPLPVAIPAIDSDGDGVNDGDDDCPGTLKGLTVDARGCAVETGSQSIVLKGVNFLPNSAQLTPEAKTVLEDAYQALAGQKNLEVELGGHTDSGGNDDFNLALSQRRANAAREYLIERGIATKRLTAKGYGETQPIEDNKTAAGRKANRRVELKVID